MIAARAVAQNPAPAPAQPVGAPAAAPAATPDPDDPAVIYKQAMVDFGSGNFAAAVSKLESVIVKAGPDAKIETVYWTLGACYFNLGNYPRAIDVLNQYVQKYPNDAKVPEAKMSIAQAYYLQKDYANSANSFKALEAYPAQQSQVMLFQGMALKENKQVDEAIEVFVRLLAGGIVNADTANGAIQLAELYAEKGNIERALAVAQLIKRKIDFLDNIARFNALAVTLGDKMLQEEKAPEALAFFRLVIPRDEVIRFQKTRTTAMQKKIEANVATFRADPPRVIELMGVNNRIKAQIAENAKTLEELEKLPDYGPGVMLRIAACFSGLAKPWEAVVVYNDFLAKYPQDKSREEALFRLAVASIDAGRGGKARDLCESYLKEFSEGKNADTVAYLLAASAFQTEDLSAAEGYFGRMLKERPSSQYKEEMQFLLANVRFSLGKFDDSAKDYQAYLADFPAGSHKEEATYRLALCAVFAGRYEEGMKGCESYIKTYPQGEFIADAKYRLGVCKFAANIFDEVLADCRAWKEQFPNNPLTGEVLALEADSLAAKGDDAGAIAAYQESWKQAGTDEVVNYSLFAAQKLMQKKGDWEGIGNMFEEFVKEKPNHPAFVMAIFWIGKAQARQGKVEEAKKFLAETVKQTIDDPTKEAVEQLLSQLAQLCARKKPVIVPDAAAVSSTISSTISSTGSTAAAPAPTPSPAPSPTATPDPSIELGALLGGSAADASPTAQARIHFAKSELARIRKKTAEMDAQIQAIADQIKPEDLSPMLLAVVGDFLLDKKQDDKAADFYQKLREEYPKSDVVEYAYNGLGEIAYRKEDYQGALDLFSAAIDQVGASAKLKDVTLGRAKSLLALGKLEESKKVFEQIAAVREWRGEATACAVFSLGQIAEKREDWAGAIANYQRVYVAYQKYLPWVAKAYIRSAVCFEKLGKTTEAQNTYRELLRNKKLAGFPEYQEAQKHLSAEGDGGKSQ